MGRKATVWIFQATKRAILHTIRREHGNERELSKRET